MLRLGSSLLNLSLHNVQLAVRLEVPDESDRNSIDRDGVSLEVENSESKSEKISTGLLGWRCHRHHFHSVANGDGTIKLAVESLDSVDGTRRGGREDLVIVGQKTVFIDCEGQQLVSSALVLHVS